MIIDTQNSELNICSLKLGYGTGERSEYFWMNWDELG